jgi:hypothetical protein
VNYNPYAAPQAAPPPQQGPQNYGGGPQPWDVGEVFSLAFEGFKRCWAILFGTYFLTAIVAGLPGQIPNVLVAVRIIDANSGVYWGMYSVFMLVGICLQALFQGGLIKIWLTVARGGTPQFGDLFSNMGKFLPLVATLFLMLFAILLGYVCFIVPGVIIGLGLMYSQFFVVDADMGPIDAMKASWKTTMGHKGKLFVLSLLGVVVAMVGLVACCIGVYATISIFWVALAIVFVRLTGRGTTSSGYDPGGYGGGGGYAPPGGGYPPAGGYGGPPPQAGPGGYGGPPQGGGGGYGGPPQGGGGGYGGPQGGGGGYGGPQGPQGGGGGYGGPQGPQGGGGGYGGPQGPQGGGGGYGGPQGPQGGGGGYGGPQGPQGGGY